MHVATRQLLKWTAAHHAVVSDQVLRTMGITIEQRKHLVELGVLERVLDGSYRFSGAVADDLARCVAACARPIGLVVSGPSAGRLKGLRRMPKDGLVYVIAPPGSNPTVEPWLVPYRTAALDPNDIEIRADGIRVTSAARTAVDLMRHLPRTDARSVIDQIIHEGLSTAAKMREVAEPLVTPGRPWARRFVAELDSLPAGRAPESHWESRVVADLIRHGVPLEPQSWLDVPHWGRVRLDASVKSLLWGVEVDVHPTHFTETGISADAGRDVACDAIGWCVSRVTRLMLEADFVGAMDALVRVYRRRASDGAARSGR